MRIHVPSALRRWTENREVIEMPMPPDVRMTIGEVLVSVGATYPGIRQRVLDDQGNLRRHVNVFVEGENVRLGSGLATQVGPDMEVWIYPALSGGSLPSRDQ